MQLEALVAQATAFAIPTPMQNAKKSRSLASKALIMALEDGNKALNRASTGCMRSYTPTAGKPEKRSHLESARLPWRES